MLILQHIRIYSDIQLHPIMKLRLFIEVPIAILTREAVLSYNVFNLSSPSHIWLIVIWLIPPSLKLNQIFYLTSNTHQQNLH